MATYTETGIAVYRLIAAKHALRLGQIAKKHGGYSQNARNWPRQIRQEFGLKPRASVDTMIAAIDACLAVLVPIAQAEGGISE